MLNKFRLAIDHFNMLTSISLPFQEWEKRGMGGRPLGRA